ncbi:MAG: DUF2680 domain-containing protein [Bacillota bacterium]|nr:DUF2680 domain-containing protein [Bacillota bacterium]
MSKKLIIGLIVTAIVGTLLISTAVFAQEKDATLDALYEQIYELRRQVVERQVELGYLTAEEGEQILERMQDQFERSLEEEPGSFYGMPGRGWGGSGGRGFGHCWQY